MKGDATVDVRGQSCPMPVVYAARRIKEIQPGQVLEIWADAEGARSDLPAWATQTGNEFLGAEDVDGYTRYFVRRSH